VTYEKYYWEPLPTYGDLFTVREFMCSVESGLFIDNDGIGYYATDTQMSDLEAIPSQFNPDIDPIFTHVMWFNK